MRKLNKILSRLESWKETVAVIIIISAGILAYWQVSDYNFINFDDHLYVSDNSYVKDGLSVKGLSWAFSLQNKKGTYWHPITWISHMTDCQLFGLDPAGHHTMNLLFHLANVILLFLFFRGLTGKKWESLFIAALFALHPINVESVAWISERKNILSTFFGILSMLAYLHYTKKTGGSRYAIIVVLFSLSLLSKPMMITLPFIFLMFDCWPLQRSFADKNTGPYYFWPVYKTSLPYVYIKKVIWEKIPLILIAALVTGLSMYSLSMHHQIKHINVAPISLRVENLLVSYALYLKKAVWPSGLSIFYPFPTSIPQSEVLLSGSLLLALSVVILILSRRFPYLSVGWLWFLGTLIPVSGLIQGGRWPEMADRWAYVPFIGLYFMASFGLSDLLKWLPRYLKQSAIAIGVICLFVLAVVTHHQAGYWKNSITLFAHNAALTKNNLLAHYNLGQALLDSGNDIRAMHEFKKALEIEPNHPRTNMGVGIILSKQGGKKKAEKYFKIALKNDPENVKAIVNIGSALSDQGLYDKAIPFYQKAVNIEPESREARGLLALALLKNRKIEDSIAVFRSLFSRYPDDSQVAYDLANALFLNGDMDEAVLILKRTLQLHPGDIRAKQAVDRLLKLKQNSYQWIRALKSKIEEHPEALDTLLMLGKTYERIHDFKNAEACYKRAVLISPNDKRPRQALGLLYAGHGDYGPALKIFMGIIDIEPTDTKTTYNIACIYSLEGKVDKAISWLEQTIQLGYDNQQQIRSDPDLANIRETVYYQKLMNSHFSTDTR